MFKLLQKRWALQHGSQTKLRHRQELKTLHETLDALKAYEFEKKEGDYTLIREPIGVILGMITPWNWPMNQITTKASAALAAGCSMVLKPSEISPYCALLTCRSI